MSTPTRRGVVAALVLFAGAALARPGGAAELLNPRYRLPAACFAYVGDPAKPGSWKLPYRHADGSVDRRRLPLAIEAMLGSYRGRTAAIPRAARGAVLRRLAAAAGEIGKLPPGNPHPAPLYRRLAAALR